MATAELIEDVYRAAGFAPRPRGAAIATAG